jgi:DNA primase
MSSIIEAIKARIDVVEEIGLVIPLEKSGKSYKGRCPFHGERTPSFFVFPDRQTWHCFGCKAGGDIFSFVQQSQQSDFREAMQYLAEKAGIALEGYYGQRDPEKVREENETRERLRNLNEEALLWFHQMLLRSKLATEARAYIQSRGISADSVVEFGLGYAPEQWEGLTNYLFSRGFTERELVMGGLAREREGETGEEEATSGKSVYDYFRNRIIFPIRDIRGRVIGFGGRALGDGKPKYLNSPQTLLFEKNSVLYALDVAKDAIKQAGQVVIVEGYVDAIIAHQYGTRQTVACIGSAITEKHIQQLKKLTRQVTLALDPDAAGSAATEAGIQEALRTFDRRLVPVPIVSGSRESKERSWQGRGKNGQRERRIPQAQGIIRLEEQVDAEINVLQLPEGEDPDELIRRDYAAWFYAVQHPLPLVEYYFVAKTANLDLQSPYGKAEATHRLLPVIAMISDRIKRDAYVRKLATMLRADERSLHDELQKVLRSQQQRAVTAQFSAPLQRGGGQGADGDKGRQKGEPEGHKEQKEVTPQNETHARGNRLDRSKENRLKWEDYLIGLLLRNPELSTIVCGIINDGDFAGTDTRELYHILNSVYSQRASSPSLQPFEQFVPPELQESVVRAQAFVESEPVKDGAGLIKEATQCATRLKRMQLLQLNTELRYLIGEAIADGDIPAVKMLQARLSELYREVRAIDTATHLQG